jgi:hypothetical protein
MPTPKCKGNALEIWLVSCGRFLCFSLSCTTFYSWLQLFGFIVQDTMAFVRWPSALKHATERWLSRSASIRDQMSHEDSEGLLEQKKNYDAPSLRKSMRAFCLARSRRYIALGGITTVLLLLLAYALSSQHQSNTQHDDTLIRNTQTLHLVVPTPDLSPDLCKTTLSAEVLHYSTPTIVLWDALDQDPRENAQRRMTAVRDYLDKLVEHNGNDTVVLLDSPSTWFQLRPEVLLKRYFEINRRGNERLAAFIGVETPEELSFEQSVVFSASSECGLASVDAGKCSRFPESPIKGSSSNMNSPRYLSQNIVIGRIKEVHEIYRRAVAIIEQSHEFSSDLAIFSDIFSSQQYHRSLLESKSLSWSQRFQGWFTGSYSHGPLAGKNDTTHHKQHPDEFGIGLDYSGELSMDTSRGPESFMLARQKNLPQDVMSSMPPFWTTTGQGLPSGKTWSDLDVFTNAHTHSAPVMVRNNITSDSDVRQKQWSRLWLRPFLRKLLDAYVDVPVMPLASVIDDKGVEQVFWSTTYGEKAGVKDAYGKWYGWDELCGGEELAGELFGDGLGEWKVARS